MILQTLQRSESPESPPSLFAGFRGGLVAMLVVLEQVDEALGFSCCSSAAQVLSAGVGQGSAHLFQSDARIFPSEAASCAD